MRLVLKMVTSDLAIEDFPRKQNSLINWLDKEIWIDKLWKDYGICVERT